MRMTSEVVGAVVYKGEGHWITINSTYLVPDTIQFARNIRSANMREVLRRGAVECEDEERVVGDIDEWLRTRMGYCMSVPLLALRQTLEPLQVTRQNCGIYAEALLSIGRPTVVADPRDFQFILLEKHGIMIVTPPLRHLLAYAGDLKVVVTEEDNPPLDGKA